MTLYQFNSLDELEQHEAVWDAGVHVGERFDGEHSIVLYQMHSFYVELYYHQEYNVLRRLRSFSNVEQLDAYVNEIDIKDLIKTDQ